MQYTAPDYYTKFQCIGSTCPDTCCAGWQIQIDPASMKKYSKMKGRIAARLKNEINWKEHCFRQYDGRCAFLNEENLCDLYTEGGGEKILCRTCHQYPRHVEEFENLREYSLSLSCPVAAKLIIERQESVHFIHKEKVHKEETYDYFDFFLFTKLTDVRQFMLQLIQDRTHPISLRMAVVLGLAHDFQNRINKNILYDVDSLLTRYSSPRVWDWFEKRLTAYKSSSHFEKEQKYTWEKLFALFDDLEVLRRDWPRFLSEIRHTLQEVPPASIKKEAAFFSVFSDTITEQLLVYFIYTYFCGAVYNENPYGKIKFSICSVLLIRECARAQWLQSSGHITIEQIIKTACRYAREVEHSDSNLLMMEEKLSSSHFSLEELLSLLLL